MIAALFMHLFLSSAMWVELPLLQREEPLELAAVERLWKEESLHRLDKGDTIKAMEKRGVGFDVDQLPENSLKTFPPELREIMRKKRQTSTVTIQCVPVECDIVVSSKS